MPKHQKIKRKEKKKKRERQLSRPSPRKSKEKKKRQHYFQRKKEKRKRKKKSNISAHVHPHPVFSSFWGENISAQFFFPILPKIHQTKQTLRVPIFIKSHSNHLNKRWASIPIFKKKNERKKERKKKKKKKKMGIYQILLLICSHPLFAHFHQIPYKTVKQKMGTDQILLCCSFALVQSLLVHLHIRWHQSRMENPIAC